MSGKTSGRDIGEQSWDGFARFAVYISVPGAASGSASFEVSGRVALTGCSCAALAAAGLAVWAAAVKLEEGREPSCHAAAAAGARALRRVARS